MANGCGKRVCVLFVSASLVIAGCSAERSKKEGVVNPLRDPNIVVSEYAAGAIQAAGGADAWVRTEWIRADCVVAFYEPELYLTRHHYDVRAWPPYLAMNAVEPEGKFTWTLTSEGFKVSDGAKRVDSPRIRMVDRGFAACVLYIMTAPVRLTVESAHLKRGAEPVKIEGRWYYPIEKVGAGGAGTGSGEVIFYQHAQSGLLEMVCLGGDGAAGAVGGNGWMTVKGYDYIEIERAGVVVPTTVEIFRGRADEGVGQRVAKIDYANLRAEREGTRQ